MSDPGSAHDTRPLFMIGVAAELAGMHPQTLRIYERRGLVRPGRTPKGTRLYSHSDIARLRAIQALSEAGLNLAGIERVMELERTLKEVQARLRQLEAELASQAEQALRELDQARRAMRAEIVHVPRRPRTLAPRIRPIVGPNNL